MKNWILLIVLLAVAVIAVVVVATPFINPTEGDDGPTYDEWEEENPGGTYDEYLVDEKYNLFLDGSVKLADSNTFSWNIQPLDFRPETGLVGQIFTLFKPFYVDLQGYTIKVSVADEYNNNIVGTTDLSGKLYEPTPLSPSNSISWSIEFQNAHRYQFVPLKTYRFYFQVYYNGEPFLGTQTFNMVMPADATYGV